MQYPVWGNVLFALVGVGWAPYMYAHRPSVSLFQKVKPEYLALSAEEVLHVHVSG